MAAEPRRWNQPDTGSHRLPIRTLCRFANINAGLPRRMGGIDYAGLTEPPGIPASQRISPFMRPAGLAKRLYPGGARGSGSALRMPVGLIKVIAIIRWRGFFAGWCRQNRPCGQRTGAEHLSNFVQFRTHLQPNAAWDFGMNHCWHHAQAGLRNRTPGLGQVR